MTSIRRAVAITASVALGTSVALALGVSASHAYPAGPATQAGLLSYNFSDPQVATITQNSPGAVVLFSGDNSLDLAASETLNIVQSDPSMILQIRYTGASPIEWDGAVTAAANLMVTSPAGFEINGSVYAGGDLMISSGDAPNDPAGPPLDVVFSPLATDGPITIAAGADLTAADQLGVFGDVVTLSGTARALGGTATVASTAQAQWNRIAENDSLSIVGGLANGSVTVDGELTAPGAEVLTPDPSTQSIDGVVRGTRSGAPGSASAALSVNGAATDFGAEAITGGAGALAGLGSHASSGDSLPVAFTSVTLGTEGAGAVPDDSTAVISGLAIDDDLTIDIIQARCLIDGGFDTHLAIGDAEFEGVPFVPLGHDFSIPNQPAFDLGGGASVAFNVQETAIVDGYEVLTITAVQLTAPGGSASYGVVECALPAQPAKPELAATGADRLDAQLGLTGAVLLALTGVALVLGRRRRTVA